MQSLTETFNHSDSLCPSVLHLQLWFAWCGWKGHLICAKQMRLERFAWAQVALESLTTAFRAWLRTSLRLVFYYFCNCTVVTKNDKEVFLLEQQSDFVILTKSWMKKSFSPNCSAHELSGTLFLKWSPTHFRWWVNLINIHIYVSSALTLTFFKIKHLLPNEFIVYLFVLFQKETMTVFIVNSWVCAFNFVVSCCRLSQ